MATLTRQDKLNRKGIIYFEVDDVFAMLSAAVSRDVNLVQQTAPLVSAAAILGGHIRDRMLRGDGPDGQIERKRDGKPYGVRTGAMYRGIEARGAGARQAELRFNAIATEADPRFEDMRQAKQWKDNRRLLRQSTLKKYRNDLKASSLYARKGFNPLEASTAEVSAMADAIAQDIGQSLLTSLRGNSQPLTSSRTDADPVLRAKLAAQWTR